MDQVTPAYAPVAQPVKPAKPPTGWAKLWAAFGLGVAAWVIAIIIQICGMVLERIMPIDQNTLIAVSELVGGICALLFILALGGKRIARPSLEGMQEAWRAALWLFLVNGLMVAIGIGAVVMGIEPLEIAEDWPAQTAILALLCLSIGLFEEATMRGLCLNGLLARMGRTRGGVYAAIILSSLMFGMLHFDPSIDFGSPLEIAQNILKVLQSGMCGFLFACILVKTRNIWAVAIIHAANDFMLLFMSNGLVDADVTTEYVATGDDGVAILTVYIVLILLYLPFISIGKKLVDQASPWRGDFYHHAAARQPVMPIQEMPPIALPVATPLTPAITPADSMDAATAKAMRGKHARPLSADTTLAKGTSHDQDL
jgi:membrane protease YdiL (CAAX protease family)